jgi:hypothetical protein
VDHAVEEGQRRQVRVGAGVGDELDLDRDERAVPASTVLVPHDERVPLGRRDDRFLARVAEPDRPRGLPDQEPEEHLDRDVLLAPEAAADVGRDDPDPGVGKPQHVGDIAEVLDDLGRHAA